MKTLGLVNNKDRVGKTNASTPLYASRTGDLSPPPGPRGPPFSPNRALPAPGTETGPSSLPIRSSTVAVRAIFSWGALFRSDPRDPLPGSESASTHSPPARRPLWLPPSRPAPSMRLGLADLAQPLVPHLAGGRRVACGRGGDELLPCLGLTLPSRLG